MTRGRVRRALLAWLACAAAVPAAARAESDTVPIHSMDVRMPRVTITVPGDGASAGYVFLSPVAKPGHRSGPMILDSRGRVVWYEQLPRSREAANLQPQVYRGEPVLTWAMRPPLRDPNDEFEGGWHPTYNVIADDHYRVRKRVRARADKTNLHAFTLTDRGTALMMGYRTLKRDLSRYGGSRHGQITDNLLQEIDVETGRVLFSWSAGRHIRLGDSYTRPSGDDAWDFFHANSIAEDLDGNLLVSARHTSAIYKIDRDSGEILWILGGKRSDFDVDSDARFYYQHDARRLPDGTITVFDNGATSFDRRAKTSKVLRLALDTEQHTASLVSEFDHPKGAGALATSQGNARFLANGNVFVGWGSSPWFSEHAPDGRVLFAGHLPSTYWQSYRAFKDQWNGSPLGKPAIAASGKGSRHSVYASWNGAIDVARWRVLAGPEGGPMREVAGKPWAGLETRIYVVADAPRLQVEALDAAGNVLAASDAVAPE